MSIRIPKSEAIKLEKESDKLFSDALGRGCTVSIALSGALKIAFEECYITVKPLSGTVDWIKWHGGYDDLGYCV